MASLFTRLVIFFYQHAPPTVILNEREESLGWCSFLGDPSVGPDRSSLEDDSV